MKNCIVSLLLLLSVLTQKAFSQNAFFRAQQITEWQNKVISLNTQVSSTTDTKKQDSLFALKRSYLDSINAVVFYYTGENSWQKILNYKGIKELYDFVFRQTIHKNTDSLWSFFHAHPGLQSNRKTIPLFNLVEKIHTEIDNKQKIVDSISRYGGMENFAADFPSLLNNIPPGFTDSLLQDSIVKLNIAGVQSLLQQSFKSSIHKIDSFARNIVKEMNIKEVNDAMVSALVPLNAKNFFAKEALLAEDGRAINTAIKNNIEEANTNAIAQNAQNIESLKNFSFPSQSEVIDALAIYLAKRVKQEAVLAFTDQLKNNLHVDSLMNIFFPETRRVFESLPDYELPSFGVQFRYAMSKDFIQLPDNFMQSPYFNKWIDTPYNGYAKDAWIIAKLIRKKYNFLEIIDQLNFNMEDSLNAVDTLSTTAIKKFAQITYVINHELYEPGKNTGFWISPERWASMSENEFDIFWALVNVKYPLLAKNLVYNRGDRPDSLSLETYNRVRMWLKQVLFTLNKFQANQNELKEKIDKDGANWEFRISSYWENVHDIINMIISNKLVKGSLPENIGKLDTTFTKLWGIYQGIQQKNYAGSADAVIQLFEYLSPGTIKINSDIAALLKLAGNKDDVAKKIKDWLASQRIVTKSGDVITAEKIVGYLFTAKSIAGKISVQVNDAVKEVEFSVAELEKFRTAINDELKNLSTDFPQLSGIALSTQYFLQADNTNPAYSQLKKAAGINFALLQKAASIFQDILTAKTSAELSKVIETYALPPGSYKIKRNALYSIDLNAYFGAYAGSEWAQDANGKYNMSGPSGAGFVFGLSAPIGISYSWAKKKDYDATEKNMHAFMGSKKMKLLKGNSHTINLSIVDLGAVVSYRLSNAADKPLPASVSWAQVLSPGIYYRSGFKGTPLCWHIGLQYAPQLRNINTVQTANTIRLNTGIMMDLPLLNFKKK